MMNKEEQKLIRDLQILITSQDSLLSEEFLFDINDLLRQF